jgi:tRNA-intron endonuclease
MSVFFGKKVISFDELIKKLKKKDKKIETKFAVYQDLRKKGYIIKTALKFGAEFRVYNKGVKPGENHARWILFTVREHDALSWHDFAAKNRVAHSTQKKLLIAIVDEESDVSYYEAGWIKP